MIEMDASFWPGKQVLVTGATGLVGSFLTEMLVKRGAHVTIILKPDDPIGMRSIMALKEKLKIIKADIREAEKMHLAVNRKDIIFHLAAVTQVLYAIRNPVEAVEVDVNGTLNILEGMRKNDSGFLVFASTDKVYGEPEKLPIEENHPLSALSPYDASKLAADRIVASYNKTYSLPVSISRCSNIIGGRDSNILRAVPSFIYELMKGRTPKVRTSSAYVRDYMYVEDAAEALMLLAEKIEKSNGHSFNFGTGKPTSIVELAKMVMKLYGREGEPVVENRQFPGEIKKQYLSYKKAREMLGWTPKYELEKSVRTSLEWYEKNPWWLEVLEDCARYYNVL